MAREAQALTVATRYQKPPGFNGTDIAWRSLCECYPTAETPEVLMALVEYCTVRRLDPFKRPVHVVPMWNSRLKRKVQTIMVGINEIEITAARTQKWAGMDLPVWGPDIEHTFRGSYENDDGTTRDVSVRMVFPAWCAVTVYRLVAGERRAFTEQLHWMECYGRAGFRSEVPNERWTKAPRQMLHKCVKSAVLRAAFPEEGIDYTAEEMDGRETEAGGILIDGKAEPPADQTDQDRQADQAYGRGDQDEAVDPLAEPNGTQWLVNLQALLKQAASAAAVADIGGHPAVRRVLREAPSTYRALVNDALRDAHQRLAVQEDDDGLSALLVEVDGMDLISLNSLPTSAAWIARTRPLIPPDMDRLEEAIEARRNALKGNIR
jgi:phage recombination protein Bet